MPRALHIEYPGATYHVMNRGDRVLKNMAIKITNLLQKSMTVRKFFKNEVIIFGTMGVYYLIVGVVKRREFPISMSVVCFSLSSLGLAILILFRASPMLDRQFVSAKWRAAICVLAFTIGIAGIIYLLLKK